MTNPFKDIYKKLGEINSKIDFLSVNKIEPLIEVIDRPELLKRLSITEPTAITWGKRGKIPELRIGSVVRYNWADVIEALKVTKKDKNKLTIKQYVIITENETQVQKLHKLCYTKFGLQNGYSLSLYNREWVWYFNAEGKLTGTSGMNEPVDTIRNLKRPAIYFDYLIKEVI